MAKILVILIVTAVVFTTAVFTTLAIFGVCSGTITPVKKQASSVIPTNYAVVNASRQIDVTVAHEFLLSEARAFHPCN
jgi:flagellar basal body-associated protein FliL